MANEIRSNDASIGPAVFLQIRSNADLLVARGKRRTLRQIAQGRARDEDSSAVCMARRPRWRNVSHNSTGR
jgi:hypothetical protein